MLYTQKTFTLPANTKNMSKEDYAYAVGLIDEVEYVRLTGHKPGEKSEDEG